jgi:Transglutaminase-like superfamily
MDVLAYYKTQSPITDPGENIKLLADLPGTIEGLYRVVQGLYLNYMDGEMYGYKIPQERLSEVNLRYIEKMLARIIELNDRPLTEHRVPEKRLIGCCRDAATLFCAMARYQGIPARVRVGFATYFTKIDLDFKCSHFIAEFWDSTERRWRLVDPELNELAIEEYHIRFDVQDVPRDQFLVGGRAWQMCRTDEADPNSFGVAGFGEMKGLPFVRGNLILDLAAQNKMEMLNWDCWGLMRRGMGAHTDEELKLLDQVAKLTQAGHEALPEMQAIFEAEADLKVQGVITCYNPVGAPFDVTLPI